MFIGFYYLGFEKLGTGTRILLKGNIGICHRGCVLDRKVWLAEIRMQSIYEWHENTRPVSQFVSVGENDPSFSFT